MNFFRLMAAALDIVPVPVAAPEPVARSPDDAAVAIAAEWKSVRRSPKISRLSCFQRNASKIE